MGAPDPRAVVPSLLLTLLLGSLLPATAQAQYFGRNKVQYDQFDFRVLETDHFDLHHYRDASDRAVRDAGRMLERWYDRLARAFQHEFEERKPIILYANQPDFQQTNVVPGRVSQGTGGVTEGVKRRVVLPFAESYGATDHVLGHELVHAFQYDLALGRGGGTLGRMSRLPLWMVEGLAEYLSLGSRDSHTAMWMRDAVLHEKLPNLEQLSTDPRYFPYRFGHAFWAYVGGRFGDETVVKLYRDAARGGTRTAIKEHLATSPDTLAREWKQATLAHYGPLLEDRSTPEEAGERILAPGKDAGRMNLAPSLSPDGRRVVFLSSRDLFTVDLFVADARTGEVQGKLASSGGNPHFDQIAFISSAGDWSPDGERFAFATVSEGDNQIAVAEVDEREVVRTYDLQGIGAVHSLAWAPGGQGIAFSGSAGGITDLYLVRTEDGSVRRLTDDRHTQLHPTWSPDGSTLAFATDRGGATNLRKLRTGPTGLGFLELETGRVKVRRPLGGAKHIDPAYGPRGESLFFISDRRGFSDVYRLNLDTGDAYQVTRLATGVSGITTLSPALTVAPESGRLMFTVFDDGDYIGYARSPDDARGRPVEEVSGRIASSGDGGTLAGAPAAPGEVLPPARERGRNLVTAYLGDSEAGLPSGRDFQLRDYESDLGLDYISQPSAGVGVDRFGTAIGGSVAAFFSDMLGNEQLGVGLQVNGGIQDIGGQVVYSRRGDRLNWALQGGRIPILTGFTRFRDGSFQGRPATISEVVRERLFVNRVAGSADYPLSTTRRFEGQLGFTRIGFDREALRTIFVDGAPVQQEETELPAPDAIHMGNASLAYVEDHSFFGFTSPVRGGRSRFEVEGNVGELEFVNVLADWRRYVFLRPVTLAFRAFHFGRYGGDAESDRIRTLFLGQETLVRGYSLGSFQGDECTPVPGEPGTCPEFDRLVGSRLGVLNAELRIPLNGTEQLGLLDWGFVPTELSLFADGGVAWTSEDAPELELTGSSRERVPVFSAGVGFRFNILGRLVTQVYWAHPFQRDASGGEWGFVLAPGW